MMKKKQTWKICLVFLLVTFSVRISAQEIYTITAGELLFQSGSIEKNGEDINTNMRFTLFFHFGGYLHYDLNETIGFFTGLGIRNVGFITQENDIKTKYRSYMLGAPLAIKLGSFKQNFYFYGGGEYEWMFHFKQKTFVNDEKIKYNDWFSNRTPALIPSVFVGVQLPYGLNVKFKYYLKDFLNNDYQGSGDYSDYTSFDKTQLWYFSVSYQIRNSEMMEYKNKKIQPAQLSLSRLR
jgi:hypothetical protein